MRLSAEDLMHHPWFADMKTRMKIRPYKPRVTPSSLSPRLCQREESDSSDEMEVTVKRAEVPKAEDVQVEVVPSPRVEPEEVKEEKPVEKPEEVKEEKPVEKPEEVKEKPVEKPEEVKEEKPVEKPEEKEEKPEEVKEEKKKEQNDQK